MYCTVLYCVVMYCTVLYCIVLYCTVLCCIVLYFTMLYRIVLCCAVFVVWHVLHLWCQQTKKLTNIVAVHMGNKFHTFGNYCTMLDSSLCYLVTAVHY